MTGLLCSTPPSPEDAEIEQFIGEIQALCYAPVREKVEDLVERLDNWKTRVTDQKKIAKVDTPLLQLLHVVEKMDCESHKSTYNEQSSEIAYFDADFVLRVCSKNRFFCLLSSSFSSSHSLHPFISDQRGWMEQTSL